MKTIYSIIFVSLLTLAGSLWYVQMAESGCRLPVYYSLGNIDPRFGISNDQVKTVLKKSEAIWEQPFGDNLLEYKEGAALKVNFIYDERQSSAEAAEKVKSELDKNEGVTENISTKYEQLVAEYEKFQASFESQRKAYEKKLASYNAEVAKYNAQGGAPADVYDRLESEKQELDAEQESLNRLADKINTLSDKINELGDKGNELIEQYNNSVEKYNDIYGTGEEFTQGDYTGKSIDVYTFVDNTELVTVLAHEMGHAMGLDHVENKTSIMYYLIGGQGSNLKLSQEDQAEFSNLCENKSKWQLWQDKAYVWLRENRPF